MTIFTAKPWYFLISSGLALCQRRLTSCSPEDCTSCLPRTVLAYLFEDRKRTQAVFNTFNGLVDQDKSLRLEKTHLKQCYSMLEDLAPTSQSGVSHSPVQFYDYIYSDRPPVHVSVVSAKSYEEVERSRSKILAAIPESINSLPSLRVLRDFNCVRYSMDYLSIECSTFAVYRLGRAIPNWPRLLKAVLTSSFYARLMLSRSHRLAHLQPAKFSSGPFFPSRKEKRFAPNESATCKLPLPLMFLLLMLYKLPPTAPFLFFLLLFLLLPCLVRLMLPMGQTGKASPEFWLVLEMFLR